MAQHVKALAIIPESLSSIPGIYKADGERTNSYKLYSDHHTYTLSTVNKINVHILSFKKEVLFVMWKLSWIVWPGNCSARREVGGDLTQTEEQATWPQAET